ncbi:hypothetical protein FOQG_01670 [Fusarium oxysporum f. sp. raphani 54005]|uniref:Uncharacterized protein n=6 Tax=Fusarium oxysporum TaxID=5507 RepID=X0DXR2_FUSOX|nr:hypothetical protein FOVG_09516 [Fusarium oxysporum f. sp. pisi HDV247]EXK98962.1 hypothetical protein FOQG_01670 [Fusarium oxysporum f. sp. raphani 54005]EXL70188.1 hypothetical protein FOPG_13953 [Fusarium oxysporum f. sp. conglutinans race 2 54008]KAF6521018.1 hypothetical protein HZS61_015276 [Fusarium oxysporum f. sp. conglutinans]KAG7429978.1 hypothetical protein Forpi1262_v009037 [Fusarium oxysporum f. sp. raphani]KAJ4048840.1 hypothetical protein NW758_005358 [Fusarium oxysporum]WK
MMYKTSPIVSKRLYDRTETNSIDNLESSGHSWSPVAQAVWKHPVDKPLLRTWDDLSGSQPDGSGDMSARASDIPLTTFEARRSSHQTHIIHPNFRKSHPRRKRQTVTVVDPAVRLESGWPTISSGEEKDCYRIAIPYGIAHWELKAHHLCLWTVKAEEVAQHYDWDKLFSDPNWYHNIVRPDIKRFREERQRREQEQVQHRIDDISAAFGTLPLDGSLSPSSSTASDHNTDNEYWEDTDRNQPTKQHIQSFL